MGCLGTGLSGGFGALQIVRREQPNIEKILHTNHTLMRAQAALLSFAQQIQDGNSKLKDWYFKLLRSPAPHQRLITDELIRNIAANYDGLFSGSTVLSSTSYWPMSLTIDHTPSRYTELVTWNFSSQIPKANLLSYNSPKCGMPRKHAVNTPWPKRSQVQIAKEAIP